MRKTCILILFILCSFWMSGQNTVLKDRITLNTGEVFVGEIQLKTNELVILKTEDGGKFQFQLKEIKSIDKQAASESTTTENSNSSETVSTQSNIKGIVDLTGGVASAKYLTSMSPNIQLSMTFGSKLGKNDQMFLGLGVGYSNTFLTDNSKNISQLPVFVRLQNNLSKKRTSPYVLLDAGYAFSLSSDFGGGILAEISSGISYRLDYKTNFIIGLYGRINSISGNLIETNDLGTFSYYGPTVLNCFGVKAGLQF